MPIELNAQNIGKKYGAQWVFRGVSLSVCQGDCLLISGGNGSGKSTLIRILTRLMPFTEGSVTATIENGEKKESLPTADYAMVSQDTLLYSELTAGEHLRLIANFRNVKLSEQSIIELTEKYKIPHRGKSIGEFSTGMKQRLKLAIASTPLPKLLFLDEPGNGLDDQGKSLLDELIGTVQKNGIVVIATNDKTEYRYGTHNLALGA